MFARPNPRRIRVKMHFPIETEAIVVEAPGAELRMTPILIDELRPDEVLVEMKYSGLCHTVLSPGSGPRWSRS